MAGSALETTLHVSIRQVMAAEHEYLVNSTANGFNRSFLINLDRKADGVGRLESLCNHFSWIKPYQTKLVTNISTSVLIVGLRYGLPVIQ